MYALVKYNIPTQTPVNLPQPYNCEVDNAVTIALHTKYVPRLPLLSSSRFTFSPRAHWQTYVSQFAQRARTATTLNYNWGAVVLGSRISLIVGDALVLAVTWWKTYRLKRAADAARVKTFIVELLLRDGAFLTPSPPVPSARLMFCARHNLLWVRHAAHLRSNVEATQQLTRGCAPAGRCSS